MFYKTIFIAGFCTTLLACNETSNKSTVYVPAYGPCTKNVETLERHLGGLEPKVEFELLLPDYVPVSEKQFNGLLKVTYREGQFSTIEPSINAFLDRCGPNGFVEISIDNLNEQVIRKTIARALGLGSYHEDFSVEVKGNDLFLFFSRP